MSKIRAQKLDECAFRCSCRIRKPVKILLWIRNPGKNIFKIRRPFAYSPPSFRYWRPLVLVQPGFEPATSRLEDWRLSIELTGRRFLGFIVECFVIRALQLSAKMISTRIITDCTKPRHSLGKPRASETSRKWTSFLFYLQNTPRIPRGGGGWCTPYSGLYMGRLTKLYCCQL